MPSIYTKIKEAVTGLIDSGAHKSIAETTQIIAKKFGLSERLINYTHIEIRNTLNESRFKRVPFNERMLFLPQCLRHSKKCTAVLGDEGWDCRKCGKCKIHELKRIAEEKGYKKVFIVPGGSMVVKLVQRYKPKGILGVACHNEVTMGLDKMKEFNVPTIGVVLLREGCTDTDVNIEEVKEKMMLNGTKG